MLLLVGKAQLAGCLKVWVKRSDGVGRRNSLTIRKLSIGDVYKHMMKKKFTLPLQSSNSSI